MTNGKSVCARATDYLMYTDGITESRNSAGEEFGEDRLIDLVLHFELNDAATLAEQLSARRAVSAMETLRTT